MDERFETLNPAIVVPDLKFLIEVPSMDERFETTAKVLPCGFIMRGDRGAFNG